MAVYVCLPLFGNPGHELEEGAPVHGKLVRELAADLQTRLQNVADMLDKLHAAGWKADMAMYEAILTHKDVQTKEEAMRRLQELGIDPNILMIVEEVQEDELGSDL